MKQKLQGLNFSNYTKEIEDALHKVLVYGVSRDIQELVLYQVKAGGKRLRPTLAFLSCLACGGQGKDALYPAVALEILHNYSLIIDDIIDHSPKRRGVPTVWKKFGKSIAECLSLDYAAALLEAVSRSRKPTLISKLLARALREIVHGEILDILFEQAGREEERYVVARRFRQVERQDYMRMIGKKSSVLFQVSCEIGGVCAGASKKEMRMLQLYGKHIGIAFQIVDDILDFYGEKEFGKPKGQDIRERKLGNILTLFALQEVSPRESKRLLQILKKKEVSEKDVRLAINAIQKTKAKEKAVLLAKQHAKRAKESLSALKPSRYRDLLQELADVTLQRGV